MYTNRLKVTGVARGTRMGLKVWRSQKFPQLLIFLILGNNIMCETEDKFPYQVHIVNFKQYVECIILTNI